MESDNKTDVFNFTSLRAPQQIIEENLHRLYIHDDLVLDWGSERRRQREVFSMQSSSEVGKIIFKGVFSSSAGNTTEINNEIIDNLFELLDKKELILQPGQQNLLINELEQLPYLRKDNTFYLLPSRVDSVLTPEEYIYFSKTKNLIYKHANSFNRKSIYEDLSIIFSEQNLWEIVFYSKQIYNPNYAEQKSRLFDTLYLLYVLRRKVTVNLDEIINTLRIFHILEYLVVDSFLYSIYKGKIDPNTDSQVENYLHFFQALFPELQDFKPSPNSRRFYFIQDKVDLDELLNATPVVHPIVAELAYYGQPRFNNIKPYLGDLKVVKQWLVGYKLGEISYIQNVMKGEDKERNLRQLDKTEELFSYSNENSQSTQTEVGNTERYELKREVERVIKSDINVGANTNMTYKYGDVFTANLGANFAYANSNQDSQKSASNYAREIMNKSVTNIQSRSSAQRSISKTYEFEEKNIHKFTNTHTNATHISGIYRWVDKKYKAQLFNFGKRWMFEFTIPEPAAFYVTSKLKAAEFDTPYLQKPETPTYETVKIPKPDAQNVELAPGDILENVFDSLRQKYDLAEFTFPSPNLEVPFNDPEKKNNLSANVDNSGDRLWISHQYRTKIPEGYRINKVSIVGNVKFCGVGELGIPDPTNEFWERNRLLFMLNGHNIKDARTDTLDNAEFHNLDQLINLTSPIDAPNGEVSLDLNFQDLHFYSVMVYLAIELSPSSLLSWQSKVYNKIRALEQARVDKHNQELEIVYNSKLSDYHNKLDDLRAKVLNDMIQGRSEAFNAQIINEELKKNCITMIAKEFDFSLNSDDILSESDAMSTKPVNINYDKYVIEEVEETIGKSPNTKNVTRAFSGFKNIADTVNFPKVHIDSANKKARYIQFLEQAFEWQQIAYTFQPYFWAHESKWIKLMNRLDYTDNNMSMFLKAGSARVVIAVTPGYYNSVMHFLATREPWEGGSLPVIGDPLFVPIYEEIKDKQDDLANASPEGEPWEFELPTSLVYLQDSSSPIPEDLIYKPPTNT